MLNTLNGLFGILLIFAIAFAVSNNKKKIPWKMVLYGLLIQFFFAIFILKGHQLGVYWSPLAWPLKFFELCSKGFVVILGFTTDGARFIFGDLALSPGSPKSIGFFFAFQVLPTIIFFSALMSVLYFLGIMQKIVQGMAWVMLRILGTSGAESLSCTANIFLGQTEAPLMVRPFLSKMTMSELLAVMIGGMATVAGGVMAAYIQMLGNSYAHAHGLSIVEGQIKFAEQLMGASIMAAPAALILSKVIWPEMGNPVTKGSVKIEVPQTSTNVIEAAAEGAGNGLQLAMNVGAMLLAFIALIALTNWGLEKIGAMIGLNDFLMNRYGSPLRLELMMGLVLQYLAVGIGVPWEDARAFGSLLGTKVVLNEFVAYLNLSDLINQGKILNEKTVTMITFALCGFANFSSIAIQIGGLSPMAPERRSDLAVLGLRAVLGGLLATLLTATIAGILLG